MTDANDYVRLLADFESQFEAALSRRFGICAPELRVCDAKVAVTQREGVFRLDAQGLPPLFVREGALPTLKLSLAEHWACGRLSRLSGDVRDLTTLEVDCAKKALAAFDERRFFFEGDARDASEYAAAFAHALSRHCAQRPADFWRVLGLSPERALAALGLTDAPIPLAFPGALMPLPANLAQAIAPEALSFAAQSVALDERPFTWPQCAARVAGSRLGRAAEILEALFAPFTHRLKSALTKSRSAGRFKEVFARSGWRFEDEPEARLVNEKEAERYEADADDLLFLATADADLALRLAPELQLWRAALFLFASLWVKGAVAPRVFLEPDARLRLFWGPQTNAADVAAALADFGERFGTSQDGALALLIRAGRLLFSLAEPKRTHRAIVERLFLGEPFEAEDDFLRPLRLLVLEPLEAPRAALRPAAGEAPATLEFESDAACALAAKLLAAFESPAHVGVDARTLTFETLKALQTFLDAGRFALLAAGFKLNSDAYLEHCVTPTLVAVASPGPSLAAKGLFDKHALADFRYEVALGYKRAKIEEFLALVTTPGELMHGPEGYWRISAAELDRLVATAGKAPGPAERLRALLTGELAAGEMTLSLDVDARVKRAVKHLFAADVPANEALTVDLMPHQKAGLAWLWERYRANLGGLLADDMGLGKTVQCLALLAAAKKRETSSLPSLIVVPAALLTHWAHEAHRFAPTLRVATDPKCTRCDVVLMSHGKLRGKDAAFFEREFDALFVDEAQAAKNPDAKLFEALTRVRARARFVMTATPVENRLEDLWAMLHLALPLLFDDRAHFRARFAAPIERRSDAKALASFKRLTAPFILRRLKSDPDVGVTLPSRIEVERFTTLTPAQAKLYDTVLKEGLGELERFEATLPEGEMTRLMRFKRRGHILKLLTALKQIVNSASQFEKGPIPAKPDAGKVEVLTELLTLARERGEKTLVFTQFVETGKRLAAWLEAAGLGPVDFLAGNVSQAERRRMIERFEAEPERGVMLVSLKAGGTGLNLTAASLVIHYDRWWNPAVENQASDRAHRIGQTKPVTVYRFVTAGTFEEKLDALLRAKRALAAKTLEGDAPAASVEGALAALSVAELRHVLSLTHHASD